MISEEHITPETNGSYRCDPGHSAGTVFRIIEVAATTKLLHQRIVVLARLSLGIPALLFRS
jgi:hypothetical protein